MNKRLTLMAAASLVLVGCGSTQQKGAGAMIGGVAGGAAASALSSGDPKWAIAGTLLGATAGWYVGGSGITGQWDEQDRMSAVHAIESKPDNVGFAWANKRSGYTYKLTPTATTKVSGSTCRAYRLEKSNGVFYDDATGYLCRNPRDGSWSAPSGPANG